VGLKLPYLTWSDDKKTLLAVYGLTLGLSGTVYAQAETPVIDRRQVTQEKRIDHGIAGGQLNEREANRLSKQQNHINKIEDKAKADGVVTNKEQGRITHAQNQASRHIARQKHDAQGARHR
jgi:hypothetical protein